MSLKIYETRENHWFCLDRILKDCKIENYEGKTEEINIKKKKKDRKISDVSIRELWNADKRSNS